MARRRDDPVPRPPSLQTSSAAKSSGPSEISGTSHPQRLSSLKGVPRAPRLVAASVLVLQALALIGFCIFYLVRLLRHESANGPRILMSVALLLIVAALLGLLARGIAAGRGWARTPSVMWQALLLPVSLGMFQSGRPDLGGVVLALAVAGIAGTVLAGGADRS